MRLRSFRICKEQCRGLKLIKADKSGSNNVKQRRIALCTHRRHVTRKRNEFYITSRRTSSTITLTVGQPALLRILAAEQDRNVGGAEPLLQTVGVRGVRAALLGTLHGPELRDPQGIPCGCVSRMEIRLLQLSIAALGIFARYFGQKFTEKCLIPHLEQAVADENFRVRKLCCEVFVDIAKNSSAEVRAHVLTPRFLALLQDPNKNVSTSTKTTEVANIMQIYPVMHYSRVASLVLTASFALVVPTVSNFSVLTRTDRLLNLSYFPHYVAWRDS